MMAPMLDYLVSQCETTTLSTPKVLQNAALTVARTPQVCLIDTHNDTIATPS